MSLKLCMACCNRRQDVHQITNYHEVAHCDDCGTRTFLALVQPLTITESPTPITAGRKAHILVEALLEISGIDPNKGASFAVHDIQKAVEIAKVALIHAQEP
jgi:hypothetical protein